MRQKNPKKTKKCSTNANVDAEMQMTRFPNGHCLSFFWDYSWRTYDLQISQKLQNLAVLLKKLISRRFTIQSKNRENFMLCKFLAAQSTWNFKNRGHTFLSYVNHYLCAKAVFKTSFPWNRWPFDIHKMLTQRMLFIYVLTRITEWITPSQRINFSKLIMHWY